CIFGSLFFVFFLFSTSFSMTLDSDSDLKEAFSTDQSQLSDILEQLDYAKQVAKENEKKKKRDITFKNPHKFIDLSDKYSVVAYSSQFDSGEKAVVGFLVIKNNNTIEIPSSVPYLIWRGETDIKSFNSITEDVVSRYFREMGIKDVYPIYSQMRLREKIDSKAGKKHEHSGSDITGGVVSEQFIDQSITRDSELKEALSKKADISMVLNTEQKKKTETEKADSDKVAKLESKIDELENRLAKLENLLTGVARTNKNIYFKDVNLHVVNGTGSTQSGNSTGNLIVGYNENGKAEGSHSIIVGSKNSSSGNGNIITGKNNSVSGSFGAALGGTGNSVTKSFGASLGGKNNKASGDFSTVAGGENNNAKGDFSIIAGGKNRNVVNENPHFNQ
ncbi:MAG: hypothetical protein ACQEQS_02190, partial [Thermodesulfobacteriota bacterium]